MFIVRFVRNVVLHAYGDADDLDPEVGDLIEMNRIWYQHWAVYIGNGEIVHLTGDAADFFSSSSKKNGKFTKAEIRRDKLKDVVGRSAQVNNSTTTWKYGLTVAMISSLRKLEAYSPEEIRERALSRVDEVGFDIGTKNCEHFAHWCRFGEAFSLQAENAANPLAL